MLDTCQDSDNKDNRPYYDAFLGLQEKQQSLLLEAIRILDGSPDITDVSDEIRSRLLLGVRPEHLLSLHERVEGWWFNGVIEHFRNKSSDSISFDQLHAQINYITEQLRPSALPIDYRESNPPADGADLDGRQFVLQLRLIALRDARIRPAIRDYYRAFQQRSRWIREQLIGIDEIENYQSLLIDEWSRFFQWMKDELPESPCEADLQQGGRRVYDWMEQHAQYRIRPDCTEPYVMRGSFHILADEKPRPRIGWHPQYLDHLSEFRRQQTGE